MLNNRKLMVAAALGGLALVSSLAAAPRAAQAEDADRCSGHTAPLCREVERCAGVQGSKVCDTEFYYFPDAQ